MYQSFTIEKLIDVDRLDSPILGVESACIKKRLQRFSLNAIYKLPFRYLKYVYIY